MIPQKSPRQPGLDHPVRDAASPAVRRQPPPETAKATVAVAADGSPPPTIADPETPTPQPDPKSQATSAKAAPVDRALQPALVQDAPAKVAKSAENAPIAAPVSAKHLTIPATPPRAAPAALMIEAQLQRPRVAEPRIVRAATSDPAKAAGPPQVASPAVQDASASLIVEPQTSDRAVSRAQPQDRPQIGKRTEPRLLPTASADEPVARPTGPSDVDAVVPAAPAAASAASRQVTPGPTPAPRAATAVPVEAEILVGEVRNLMVETAQPATSAPPAPQQTAVLGASPPERPAAPRRIAESDPAASLVSTPSRTKAIIADFAAVERVPGLVAPPRDDTPRLDDDAFGQDSRAPSALADLDPVADLRSLARADAPPPVRVTSETAAGLAVEIARRLEARHTRFDVTLNPEGLGQVRVAVDIGRDGALSAALTFERPHAAAELNARSGELKAALEQAGFDLSQGSLSFASDGREGYAGERRAPAVAHPYAPPAGEIADDLPPVPVHRRASASGLDVRV